MFHNLTAFSERNPVPMRLPKLKTASTKQAASQSQPRPNYGLCQHGSGKVLNI